MVAAKKDQEKQTLKYGIRRGFRFAEQDAQIICDAFNDLCKRSGKPISAMDVLDAARPSSSPLHRFFEWDDKEAAEQHRLEQARYLCQSVKVEIIGDGRTIETRAIVNIVRDGEGGYWPGEDAVREPALRGQLIADALYRLEGWRKQFASLREFDDLFVVIDKTIENLAAKKDTAEQKEVPLWRCKVAERWAKCGALVRPGQAVEHLWEVHRKSLAESDALKFFDNTSAV